MSAVASGCSGSLMHFTTIDPVGSVCMRARGGRKSFAFGPFARDPDGIDQEWGYLEEESRPPVTDRHVWLIKKYSRQVDCPFCGGPDDDPFHLFCECNDA
jgi:hypothetical protein